MLQLYEYELPFRSPFITGSSTFNSRRGILLRFRQNGIDLVTEASPLPKFSQETLSEVKETLIHQKNRIEQFFERDFTIRDVRDFDAEKDLAAPSIQFAVSFLALALLAERRNKKMAELLHAETVETILVNDIIAHGSIGEMEKQIRHSVQKGFQTLKIKTPHPPDDLATLLSGIHEKFPVVQFRLDANQSWPVPSLKKNCELFKDLPVQYVEEPIAVNSVDEIPENQMNCLLPIALDESIKSFSILKNVLQKYPGIHVIVKPMMMGNILKIHETISHTRSSFKDIVVTTSLESMVGRSMVATVSSLIGDPQTSHGLHTGRLFAQDLLPDFKIKKGKLTNFPEKPGYKSFEDIKRSYIKKLG